MTFMKRSLFTMMFLSLCTAAFGSEALIEAAKKGDVAAVNKALEGKVDIDARQNNATALMWAAHNGHDDVAEILINKGADVNAKDAAGYTPLVYAALEGHTDILALMIKHGGDVNTKTKNGKYVLTWAVENGNNDAVKTLIEAGADVNIKSPCGASLVLTAVINNHTDTAIMLVGNKIDINAADEDGMTPLMTAAEAGNAAAKDSEGQTAKDHAELSENKEVIELLK